MKCVILMLDGLGDRPHKILKNRTPLQAARTPALDRIASQSACGIFHAGLSGEPLPSEIAHLIMFGYDRSDYPGRGYLEALGSGISLKKNEIALLAHLAAVENKNGILYLTDTRPDADNQTCSALMEYLNRAAQSGRDIRLEQTHKHDCILIMKGGASRHITDSDPIENGMPLIEVNPLDSHKKDIKARNTAKRLNKYIEETWRLLDRHEVNVNRKKNGEPPLNCIITQRAGEPRRIDSFESLYGMKGLVIASGRVYKGISRYTGMDFIKDSDTGDTEADFRRRIETALENLNNYDFIHVHTKAPDEAAHSGNPLLKKKVIEDIDRAIAGTAAPLLENEEVVLIAAADHSTPSSGTLIHSGEPVPLLMHGRTLRRDNIKKFDEISAAAGALGQLRGKEFILTVLNALDRARLTGLTDHPGVPLYRPAVYKPFKTKRLRSDEK